MIHKQFPESLYYGLKFVAVTSIHQYSLHQAPGNYTFPPFRNFSCSSASVASYAVLSCLFRPCYVLRLSTFYTYSKNISNSCCSTNFYIVYILSQLSHQFFRSVLLASCFCLSDYGIFCLCKNLTPLVRFLEDIAIVCPNGLLPL
jgi:hypothetical protein